MDIKQNHRIALMALALTIFPLALSAGAQDKPPTDDQTASKPADHCDAMQSGATKTRTFYLTNVSQQNDANEIDIAVRNMLCPSDRIYFVREQHALIVQAPPEQLALAEKLITDLDRPRKTYRLTYTLTELDAGKEVGTQHFSMVVVSGQKTNMREGDKIPIATGSFTTENSSSQTQFTYLDIGMSFDATVEELGNGVRLQSKVEQSSLGQPSTIANVVEPVVRQSVVEGAAFLLPGIPVMLGSIDVPNSTRHLDIAVVLNQIK